MQDKRTFKVLAPITKQDGGTFWIRCGTGHLNRDSSINIYLDVLPRDGKLTLRELDEEDLRRREAWRAGAGGGSPPQPADAPALSLA
ncbi:MAG TPA: hypothetical protein VGC42_19320 [Kofleriaceae bacterium]